MDSKFPTDIANDPSTTVQRIAAVDESTHRTELDELVKHLVRDFKARNVAVIDMRDKCQWTDWMVVSEGVSEAHVKRMTRQFYQLVCDEPGDIMNLIIVHQRSRRESPAINPIMR
jgi:hypothetical protein